MAFSKNLSVFALALGLSLTTFAAAQAATKKDPGFTVSAPAGTMSILSAADVAKLHLPNASTLSQDEREAALQKSCSADSVTPKALTFCVAWTGANCTGTGLQIPCGFFANATDFGLPQFQAIQFGCVNSFLATGRNLTGSVFRFTGFPQDSCISANPVTNFASAACTN
jgi:hypothetical protein